MITRATGIEGVNEHLEVFRVEIECPDAMPQRIAFHHEWKLRTTNGDRIGNTTSHEASAVIPIDDSTSATLADGTVISTMQVAEALTILWEASANAMLNEEVTDGLQ